MHDRVDYNPAEYGTGVEFVAPPQHRIERSSLMMQHAPSAAQAFQQGLSQVAGGFNQQPQYQQPQQQYHQPQQYQPQYQQAPYQPPQQQMQPWDQYGMSREEYYYKLNAGEIAAPQGYAPQQNFQQPSQEAPAYQSKFPAPKYEMFALKEKYIVYIEVPGVDPEKDIEVSFDEPMLMVKIFRPNMVKDMVQEHGQEIQCTNNIQYGDFELPIKLPKPINDDIDVTVENGVLRLELVLRSKGQAKTLKVHKVK